MVLGVVICCYSLFAPFISFFFFFFFFNDTATTEIYTLSLHDALPFWVRVLSCCSQLVLSPCFQPGAANRSEEHTSELQSPCNLVCRLLLEKKKKKTRLALIIIKYQNPVS